MHHTGMGADYDEKLCELQELSWQKILFHTSYIPQTQEPLDVRFLCVETVSRPRPWGTVSNNEDSVGQTLIPEPVFTGK